MHNMAQQGQLCRMLAACDAANIPVVLLKGLWLAETVYRDIKARPTGDIDLLFQPSDMPRFTLVARELGFAFHQGVTDLRDLAPWNNEYSLVHCKGQGHFDIHWAVTHPGLEKNVDESKLWSRSEIVTLAGRSCRSLGVEDHLLYLCFHAGTHHQFKHVGPRGLLDVALLLAKPPRPINWTDLSNRAFELGWSRTAWLVFELVRENLGVSPPAEVIQALRPLDVDNNEIFGAALEALLCDQKHKESVTEKMIVFNDKNNFVKKLLFIIKEVIFVDKKLIVRQFNVPVNAPGFLGLYVKRWLLLLRTRLPQLVRIAVGERLVQAELRRSRKIAQWLNE